MSNGEWHANGSQLQTQWQAERQGSGPAKTSLAVGDSAAAAHMMGQMRSRCGCSARCSRASAAPNSSAAASAVPSGPVEHLQVLRPRPAKEREPCAFCKGTAERSTDQRAGARRHFTDKTCLKRQIADAQQPQALDLQGAAPVPQ